MRSGGDYKPKRSLSCQVDVAVYGPAHERASVISPLPEGPPNMMFVTIIEAADKHFSRYGYEKDTVSDLAKAIGFSKGLHLQVFDSKQPIGEQSVRRRQFRSSSRSNKPWPVRRRQPKNSAGVQDLNCPPAWPCFSTIGKLYDIAASGAGEDGPSAGHTQAPSANLIDIVARSRKPVSSEPQDALDDAHAISSSSAVRESAAAPAQSTRSRRPCATLEPRLRSLRP